MNISKAHIHDFSEVREVERIATHAGSLNLQPSIIRWTGQPDILQQHIQHLRTVRTPSKYSTLIINILQRAYLLVCKR